MAGLAEREHTEHPACGRIGDGDVGASEAADLAKVVAGFGHTIVTAEMEQRLDEAERTIRAAEAEMIPGACAEPAAGWLNR